MVRAIKRFIFGESEHGDIRTVIYRSGLSLVDNNSPINCRFEVPYIVEAVNGYKTFIPEIQLDDESQVPQVKENIQSVVDTLDALTDPCPVTTVATNVLARQLCEIANSCDRLEVELNLMTDKVGKAERAVHKAAKFNFTDDDTLMKQVQMVFKQIIDYMPFGSIIEDVEQNLGTAMVDNNLSASLVKREVAKLISGCESGLKLMMFCSDKGLKMYEITIKFLHAIFKDYNIGAKTINYKVEIPKFFADHMREHLRYKSLNVKYIVVTNLMPSSWDKLFNGIHTEFAHTTGKSSICFVNINALRLAEDKGIDISQLNSAQLDMISRKFLETIVHEFKHNADAQKGKLTDFNYINASKKSNTGDEFDDYWNNKFEVAARNAGYSFEPSDQDLRWAKQVITEAVKRYKE